VLRTFAFHGGDTTSGALEITDRTESGAVIGKPRRTERRWTKFQAQASYPRSSTIITQDDADTPAGDFDCWLYTVREKQDGRVTVRREWYAWSLPGPPVRTIEQVDGKTVLTTTLVEVMLPRR
jgi:hypothetical protein